MNPESKLKIIFSPADANPYQHLLGEHLKNLGTEIFQERNLSMQAFNFKFLSQFQIVHLHWLQPHYHDNNIVVCLIKSLLFQCALAYLNFKKIPVVITMHNLLPHTMRFPRIDRYFRRKTNKIAKALFFHDEQAKNDYIEMFGQGKARHEIIPHGIYPESLVPLPEKKLAREYLKIPQATETVCLFMGRASSQKGYDVVLSHMDFFNKRNIHVIFAGADFTDEYLKDFANCTVLPYFVPDFELPVLFAAADSILMPYSSCTTSGLAVLAIGFGTPLVCSDVPYLKELCNRDLGVVCNHLDAEDFASKIMTSVQLTNNPNYKVSRSSFLESNSWGKVAQKTYTQYKSLL